MMLAAVVVAPMIAVFVQRNIDILRERRGRKTWVFHTLMATRAAKVSPEHVRALNMIELEFYGWKLGRLRYVPAGQRAVTVAWKNYLDFLTTPTKDSDPMEWRGKADDLLTDLLDKMADCLGYHFDTMQLKRGIYYPQAHSVLEAELQVIRDRLAKILNGEEELPVRLVISDDAIERQDALQKALLDQASGKNIVRVRLERGPRSA